MQKPVKYIDKVKGPIIKPCPCAKNHIRCNYAVVSQILNCLYNCSYCYLHTFYGRDEIVIYNNHEKIISEIKEYMENSDEILRIGTGEFSDSLALPDAVSLSKKLISLFASQDSHLLELKTKSDNVEELLNLKSNGKTVLAWSLNPQKIIDTEESDTVSLERRLSSAARCINAGYRVAFHFDPIIYFEGWEEEYNGVIEDIFFKINPKDILWISLGALRFPSAQKKIMEERFKSRIPLNCFEKGMDNKLRYPEELRAELFKHLYSQIRMASRDIYVYLCMETAQVWKRVGIENKESKYFSWEI
jgi:spore photoproduct lyase